MVQPAALTTRRSEPPTKRGPRRTRRKADDGDGSDAENRRRPAGAISRAPPTRARGDGAPLRPASAAPRPNCYGSVAGRGANAPIWRAYASTGSFRTVISGVVAAQSAVRGCLARRRCVGAREAKAGAVAAIQSAWRGFVARRGFRGLVAAATTCQSAVRRRSAARQVELARLERRLIALRAERALKTRAAVVISASWRRFRRRRRRCAGAVRGVILCQALFRQRLAAKALQSLKRRRADSAAATIASRYRGHIAKRHFRQSIHRIAVVQSLVRGSIERRKFSEMKEAAIKISSAWRKFHCEMVYNQTLRDIILCQAIVRRAAAIRQVELSMHDLYCQMLYEQTIRDVTLCQSAFRRLAAARKAESLRRDRRAAASAIVSAKWRAFAARKQFARIKARATMVQALARGRFVRNFPRDAATRIGSQWRKFGCSATYNKHARKATILIQTRWRVCIAKNQFAHAKRQITLLQSSVRRWREVRHLKLCKGAATTISSYRRRYYCWTMRKHALCSAVAIQARWRGCIAMKLHARVMREVVLLQSSVRRWRAVQHLKQCKRAATYFSSRWRRFYCSTAYRRTLKATTAIQARLRAFVATKQYAHVKRQATLLQSSIRRWRAVQHLKQCKRAATYFSSRWRRFYCLTAYRRTLKATTAIQARLRAFIATKQYAHVKRQATLLQSSIRRWRAVKYLSTCKEATATISSCWRRYHCQMLFQQVVICATTIQSKWRSSAATEKYTKTKSNVVLIQSVTRGWMASEHFKLSKRAATAISSAWRRHFCSVVYRQAVTDIIICQAVVRRVVAARLIELLRYKCDMAPFATTIQTKWRSFVVSMHFRQVQASTSLIQRAIRMKLAFMRVGGLRSKLEAAAKYQVDLFGLSRKRLLAILTIQMAYRSYVARKSVNDRRECLRICNKISSIRTDRLTIHTVPTIQMGSPRPRTTYDGVFFVYEE